MGYAYYEIERFNSNKLMKRGYSVLSKCHKKGCDERIDRGIAYLCYNCGWYFCGKHLTFVMNTDGDEFLQFDCFAGRSGQVCEKCAKEFEESDIRSLEKL